MLELLLTIFTPIMRTIFEALMLKNCVLVIIMESFAIDLPTILQIKANNIKILHTGHLKTLTNLIF